MSDALVRQALEQLSQDLSKGREYMQAIAGNVAKVGGTCMRIEAMVTSLDRRLDELREDHDRVCVEFAQADRAIAARISKIEKQAAAVRAWAAGAAAAVVGVFGAVAWIAAKLPGLLTVVGGK